ncbi:MAG: hypothetical protein AAGC74_12125 [Verrucomicrobiota bacterium]
MSTIETSELVEVHGTYVERIHDFRKEQQTVLFILLGIYSLVASKIIDGPNSATGLGSIDSLATLASVATWVLAVLYLNHALMVVVLAGSVRRIEERMGMDDSISFFQARPRLRWRSFLISLTLPFLLHLGLIVFLRVQANLGIHLLLSAVAVDVVLLALAYVILRRVAGSALKIQQPPNKSLE